MEISMKELKKNLEQFKNGKQTLEQTIDNIISVDENTKINIIEDKPILIGHLKRIFGYKGFDKINVGTPVYSFNDRYYFEMTVENTNIIKHQIFLKDTLLPFIRFI